MAFFKAPDGRRYASKKAYAIAMRREQRSDHRLKFELSLGKHQKSELYGYRMDTTPKRKSPRDEPDAYASKVNKLPGGKTTKTVFAGSARHGRERGCPIERLQLRQFLPTSNNS